VLDIGANMMAGVPVAGEDFCRESFLFFYCTTV
jgi:hypothetical protein